MFFLCISRAQTMHLERQSLKSVILFIHWAPFWGFVQIPARDLLNLCHISSFWYFLDVFYHTLPSLAFCTLPTPCSPDLPLPILLISPCSAELPTPILPSSHPLFSRYPAPYSPDLPPPISRSPPHILPSSRPLFSRASTPCSPEGEKGFQRFGSWLSKLTIY